LEVPVGHARWLARAGRHALGTREARAFSGFNEHPLVNYCNNNKSCNFESHQSYQNIITLTLKMFVMKEVLKKKTKGAIYLGIINY
jgi:hypothetical protein